MPIHREAPKFTEQDTTVRVLETGIKVIDLLARLDGIDFRQTAPVKTGKPFIRPYGDAWKASEAVLSEPLPGINPGLVLGGELCLFRHSVCCLRRSEILAQSTSELA